MEAETKMGGKMRENATYSECLGHFQMGGSVIEELGRFEMVNAPMKSLCGAGELHRESGWPRCGGREGEK